MRLREALTDPVAEITGGLVPVLGTAALESAGKIEGNGIVKGLAITTVLVLHGLYRESQRVALENNPDI